MSISKLAKIAKKTLSTGNYTPLNDIILLYPNGVYVNGITVKAGKNQNNAIAFTYDTALSKSFNGGNSDSDSYNYSDGDNAPYFFAESGDLKKLVTAWQDDMTLDEIDSELAENPIIMRVYKIQTRNGRDYVKVHIVEDTAEIDQMEMEADNARINALSIERLKVQIAEYQAAGDTASAERLQSVLDKVNEK